MTPFEVQNIRNDSFFYSIYYLGSSFISISCLIYLNNLIGLLHFIPEQFQRIYKYELYGTPFINWYVLYTVSPTKCEDQYYLGDKVVTGE